MVQQGNWFPLKLNHRLYMHMYSVARRKNDLCKLKWLKKSSCVPYLKLNEKNESGNQMADML